MRGAASIKLPTGPFSWLAPLGWGGGTPKSPSPLRNVLRFPTHRGPALPQQSIAVTIS